MSYNNEMIEKYRGNFLKEVTDNVEEGDWVKMCMQCGVCSGSCPLGPHWEHPPQSRQRSALYLASSSDMVTSTSSKDCRHISTGLLSITICGRGDIRSFTGATIA